MSSDDAIDLDTVLLDELKRTFRAVRTTLHRLELKARHDKREKTRGKARDARRRARNKAKRTQPTKEKP